VTGDPRRWASDTGAAGAVHFFGPFLYRSAFGSRTTEEECEQALAHLEQVILLEGDLRAGFGIGDRQLGRDRAAERLPARRSASYAAPKPNAARASG
jgi:hypothetical protein